MTTRRSVANGLQWIVFVVLLVLIARHLVTQWDDLHSLGTAVSVRWSLLAVASLIVLVTYAALVQAWRLLMVPWGAQVPYMDAVRIWTAANLGRYIPGKVWSIGALAVLAERRGVPPVAATGAALLSTMLNLGAGVAVLALTGSAALRTVDSRFSTVALVLALCFLLGVLWLPHLFPTLVRRVQRLRGAESAALPLLPHRYLWAALLINACSWVGYGLAFAVLAHAVVAPIGGALSAYVAIWTASYLAGYLALVAPGGIGVREVPLVLMLGGMAITSPAEATLLAIVSRLWLTVLEILPGLLSLASGVLHPRRAEPS
jgi:hypothetical protein